MPATAPAVRRTADTLHELRRVLAAECISNFGAMLSRLAIPWLAALVLDATPLQMAALLVADVAAAALGALLLGAWVERRGKREVMLWCDGARAAVLAALALLAWQSRVTMTMLALAAAANGVLTMAFEVARSAWMAQRLAAHELTEGNARLSMVGSLSETAAFALGGWLFQWLGAVVALVIDALSYLASAWCLRGVPEVQPATVTSASATSAASAASATSAATMTSTASPALATPRLGARVRGAWLEVSAGLRVVAAHRTLRALAWLEGLLALAGSMVGTSYMIYVARDLAIPTGTLGLVFAVGGLGAIAGARLAAAASHRIGLGGAMTAGLAAVAVGAACIPLASGPGLWAIALLVMHQIVGDGGHTLFAVHDRTLRQTVAPAHTLARADAAIRFGGQVATLLGAAVGGLVGNALDARGTLVLGAAVLLLAALFALVKLRGLNGPSEPPAPDRAAPAA